MSEFGQKRGHLPLSKTTSRREKLPTLISRHLPRFMPRDSRTGMLISDPRACEAIAYGDPSMDNSQRTRIVRTLLRGSGFRFKFGAIFRHGCPSRAVERAVRRLSSHYILIAVVEDLLFIEVGRPGIFFLFFQLLLIEQLSFNSFRCVRGAPIIQSLSHEHDPAQ